MVLSMCLFMDCFYTDVKLTKYHFILVIASRPSLIFSNSIEAFYLTFSNLQWHKFYTCSKTLLQNWSLLRGDGSSIQSEFPRIFRFVFIDSHTSTVHLGEKSACSYYDLPLRNCRKKKKIPPDLPKVGNPLVFAHVKETSQSDQSQASGSHTSKCISFIGQFEMLCSAKSHQDRLKMREKHKGYLFLITKEKFNFKKLNFCNERIFCNMSPLYSAYVLQISDIKETCVRNPELIFKPKIFILLSFHSVCDLL